MCVNYQLKPAATECRAATGECDLPEYCNGADPDCPSDVYRRNTESCTVNGVCQQSILSLFSNIIPSFVFAFDESLGVDLAEQVIISTHTHT